MKSLICVIVSLASLSAFAADFSGHWVGTDGKMGGAVPNTSCSTMVFNVTQTASQLTIDQQSFSCGMVSMNASTYPFTIAGTDLVIGGTKYGSLSGNQLLVKFVSDDGSLVTTVILTTPGTAAYTQQFLDKSNNVEFTLTATLRKQ